MLYVKECKTGPDVPGLNQPSAIIILYPQVTL